MISTRTGHWGYTHMDCREEQKAQSCLRQHLGCVPSCKWVPKPRWSHCLRLSVTAEHHLGAAESHKEGTATPWCKSNFSVPTEDSKKPRLKTGNKEALFCPQFSISLIHPEEILPSFCWTLKRLARDVLLGAVLELFIPRSSPAIQETHSPIASIGFKHLTLNLENCGEWQPRNLSRCLPHWTEYPRQSATMGNFHVFLPFPFFITERPSSFWLPPWNPYGHKILLYSVL